MEIPTCFGSALEFDGTSNYVSVAASSAFAWGSKFTAEAWVWWGGDNGADSQIIVDHGAYPYYSFTLAVAGTTTSSHSFCDGVDAGEVLFMVAGTSGSSKTCLKSGDVLPAEAWSHVAASYSSGNMYLFIDGVKVVTGRAGSAAADATSQALTVGGTSTSGSSFLGVLDEVRMSDAARYTADFTPTTEATADSDTVLLYLFDEGSGTTAGDETGSHDGTISGATWASTSSRDAGG